MSTIKIGKIDVNKDDAWIYINHFGKDKSDISSWEKRRKYLHDYIFENLKLDRDSKEGDKFRKAFDKWAEPHILRLDPLAARAKNLTNTESSEELNLANIMLEVEIEKQKFLNSQGGRNFNSDDKNSCRICNKELIEGIPRYNDHLIMVYGYVGMNAPICMNCSENNPDEYHIAFKKQHC